VNEVYEWRDAPAADFAVIGDPVAHSLSPRMHEAAYEALGLPYRYVAVRVPAGEVREALDYLASLGYRGVNATVPHKREAMEWARDADEIAQSIGVANTLDLTSGRATNTDGPGFLDTLSDLRIVSTAEVIVLGAGGTARALAAVLPKAMYRVKIWNRTRARAQELASEFGLTVLDEPTADADLVVNTTSVGLHGERVPLDWSSARESTVAYDMVYGQTRFLEEAVRQGLETVDGKPLLVAQGARSFAWWLEIDPPRSVMMKAIQ